MTCKKRGFTLIEIIVVIAMLAVLATIAAPRLMVVAERSQEAADIATAKVLTDATAAYCAQRDTTLSAAFIGISSDEARIQVLIDDGLIQEIPSPQQKNASFTWSADSAAWVVVGPG